MMQYRIRSLGGANHNWLRSVLKTPFELIDEKGGQVIPRLTSEGVVYDVGSYIYRWADPDPLVEALMLVKRGAKP